MQPKFVYAGEVVRWIDGDSVVLDVDCGFNMWLRGESVRLYGIDTSDTRGGTPELKWLGNLAKQFVNESLPPGTKVVIKTYLDRKGKFGRILGELYQEGSETSINDDLKQQRLAVDYHGQNKKELIELHELCIEYHKSKSKF